MNTEDLHVALQQSFSPDSNLRDPAEKLIKNLKYVQGSAVMLLQIAAEKQVQFEVRQAAAIHLKNLCKDSWDQKRSITGLILSTVDGTEQVILDDETKNHVRANVVDALLTETEKSIQDLMAESLHYIATHDYPDRWPNLLPTLLQTISQSENGTPQMLHIHNGLVALRKLCKRYEYKPKEARGPLNQIADLSFPLLLPLAQRLLEDNSLEAALTLKLILKIFWSSTQFFLPHSAGGSSFLSLSNPQIMQPWFDVLSNTLAKPLADQPATLEERNAWPWWKAKKWSARIMSRLFARYGIPAYAEKEAKVFAQYFVQHVAPLFLGPVCETLNLRPSGQFCTDRVLYFCLTFVDHAIELAPTYKMLKPHLDFILFKVCFPSVCFTKEDIVLFDEDPHEFVHKQNSPMGEFYDPRLSAITVVDNLVKHRGQDVITGLLSFLNNILQNYSNGSQSHVEKDGCLLILGSLSVTLFKKKKYSSQIEPLFVTHIFPDFQSPISYLRSRACWMVQQFHFMKLSDGGNLNTLIQSVLQALSDPALPVQIEASKALRYLIKVDGAHETLIPVLPQILEQYFRIMNEIGNDEVVLALQNIIDQFGDQIEPHAFALVSQLSNAFSSYIVTGEDDDDAAMAAAQCLECISTVLKGVCERPDLYRKLEPLILPMLKHILGNEGEYVEYLEYGFDILTFLTFFQDDITPQLWEFFPMIYIAFDRWASDYLNIMVPVIDNFIGKAPQTFLSGVAVMPTGNISYIDLIFLMVKKTVVIEKAPENEIRKALSLYMCILHNCPGQVDNYLPTIFETVLAKLGTSILDKIPLTRISIFQVIGSALHYNPQLALAELEKRGVTAQVFAQWMTDSEEMDTWLPRKITVLGLSSILLIPTSSLPSTISSAVPQLITSVTGMMEKMQQDAEIIQNDVEKSDEEKSWFNDEDDLKGYGEDEDVHNVEDEAYLDAFAHMDANDDIAKFLMGDAWGDDDDDDDDYVSPLDDIDTLIFYANALKSAFDREPVVSFSLFYTILSLPVPKKQSHIFFLSQIASTLPQETLSRYQQLATAAIEQSKRDTIS